MTFISENEVRRVVQIAVGHGFLVGYLSAWIGAGLCFILNPALGIGFLLSVLIPSIFARPAYLNWVVNKVKEGN